MSPLPPARLLLITDFLQFGEQKSYDCYEKLLSLAPPGGVLLQLRNRELPPRRRWELGQKLRLLTQKYQQGLLVNEDLALARLLGADGVHLTEAAILSSEARQLWPEGLITRALHRPEPSAGQAGEIWDEGVDGWVLSPVMAPRKGRPPWGVEGLQRLRKLAPQKLIYALGGVGPEQVQSCLWAGASGVAVLGAPFVKGGPEALVKACFDF